MNQKGHLICQRHGENSNSNRKNSAIQRDLSFKTTKTSHCNTARGGSYYQLLNETEDAYRRDAHFQFLDPLSWPNMGIK